MHHRLFNEEEEEDFDYIGDPVTFDPVAKLDRHTTASMGNAHIRFALCEALHGTDKRNASNAASEQFWIAARWIAGDY